MFQVVGAADSTERWQIALRFIKLISAVALTPGCAGLGRGIAVVCCPTVAGNALD